MQKINIIELWIGLRKDSECKKNIFIEKKDFK